MSNGTDKGDLSEADICMQFITPAVQAAGWDLHTQIRRELYYTKGRIIVRGKVHTRGEAKRADYVLYHKPNLPLVALEAKDNNHSVGAGMQQALRYAEDLDLPFAASSNGDAFLFHDRTGLRGAVEQELSLEAFPSPDELWAIYRQWRGLSPEEERVVRQDYHDDASGREPRYYQRIAINRTVEAIATGQDRILLVMATGTGKTYTAFQIIWRLWKAGARKRILYLADRNILIDQARLNDFKPFGGVMTKITNRQVDKSYEVYLALYQAISGTEESHNIFRQFSRDFFDLIVVDECHRGSADEASAWREILDYFSGAAQIGMTATPKETKDISNIDYFGEPVFTYSLRQGIEDGFLAPYKVIRVDLDRDLEGWRPTKGQVDERGEVIEDRIYDQADMDRTLVLEERTKRVAEKVTQYLKEIRDRYAKTIVFCEDIDHAERMRQALVNVNQDIAADERRYVMRITGDNDEGKAQLDNFIDPEQKFPVIATTSRLLTTGVDAQTCRLVVLDRRIQSMTEFKQIIGRGTRVNEDFGKLSFAIMDFKKATELFADPDFDGDPVSVYVPKGDDPIAPPDEVEPLDDSGGDAPASDDWTYPDGDGDEPTRGIGERRTRYYVRGVPVMVVAERVQYLDKDGKLITESLRDYTRRTIRDRYASLDAFLQRWRDSDRKDATIDELVEQGVLFEAVAQEVGREYSAFDLVCHLAFDRPPRTRRERAQAVRKSDYFERYEGRAREVLDALLAKYADEAVEEIENIQMLTVPPVSALGSAVELVGAFGGREQYEAAVRELLDRLYEAA